MIENPHGRTNVIYHSSSQQYLDKMMLNEMIAGRTSKKEGREACLFSAAHPQQSKAVPDRKSCQPRIVPSVHHKWHTETVCEDDLVKAKDVGLKFYETLSYADVHFGQVPSECFARVDGHEQTILHERPLEVAPHAPAIQADVRASGGRLLNKGQQQKKGPISSKIFLSFYKHLTEKSFKKNCFSIKKKGMEVNARTAELYSEQCNTDITELAVIDETTQCEKCKEHNAEGKSFCICGFILQASSAEKRKNMLKDTTARKWLACTVCSGKSRQEV